MPPYGVPRVSLNFVGFPPSSNSHSKAEAPSRRVIAELPESNKSRNTTIYDLVVQAKREHLSDDDGVDPNRCTFYTSDFAAIPASTSAGVLRDGEPVIVAYFGGNLKKGSSKDGYKDKDDKHGSSSKYDYDEKPRDRDRDRDRNDRSDRDKEKRRDYDDDNGLYMKSKDRYSKDDDRGDSKDKKASSRREWEGGSDDNLESSHHKSSSSKHSSSYDDYSTPKSASKSSSALRGKDSDRDDRHRSDKEDRDDRSKRDDRDERSGSGRGDRSERGRGDEYSSTPSHKRESSAVRGGGRDRDDDYRSSSKDAAPWESSSSSRDKRPASAGGNLGSQRKSTSGVERQSSGLKISAVDNIRPKSPSISGSSRKEKDDGYGRRGGEYDF